MIIIYFFLYYYLYFNIINYFYYCYIIIILYFYFNMKKNFNTSFPILVIVLFACMGSFTSQALKINFGRVDAHKELAESN